MPEPITEERLAELERLATWQGQGRPTWLIDEVPVLVAELRRFRQCLRESADIKLQIVAKLAIAQREHLAVAVERDEVIARLPDGMKHCTILFKSCPNGHGWLTAANWVQHGCPTCELQAEQQKVEQLKHERDDLEHELADARTRSRMGR